MIDTWNCEVCHKERKDEDISVLTIKTDFYGSTMSRNVKYCNDNPTCLDEAVEIAKRDTKHE